MWCTGSSLCVEGQWASELSFPATTGLTVCRGGCGGYLGIHVLCKQQRLANLKGFGGKGSESVEGGGTRGRYGRNQRTSEGAEGMISRVSMLLPL